MLDFPDKVFGNGIAAFLGQMEFRVDSGKVFHKGMIDGHRKMVFAVGGVQVDCVLDGFPRFFRTRRVHFQKDTP